MKRPPAEAASQRLDKKSENNPMQSRMGLGLKAISATKEAAN